MKVSCLQMNMKLGCPEENFAHAEQLICNAMKDNADVLVLPETWNTGFFPKENLTELSCRNGYEVNTCIGELAKKYKVNIVAGSVSNVRGGKVYNTAFVFDRDGICIAEYDKTHLFTLHQKTYTPEELPFRNRRNRGEVDQYYVSNSHEAVLDKDTFAAVQEMLKKNLEKEALKAAPKKYFFSGKIFCVDCGWAYKRRVQNDIVYWVCSKKRHSRSALLYPSFERRGYRKNLLQYV